MASGHGIRGWLKARFGRRTVADVDRPLLLNQAVQDGYRFNAISQHVAKYQIGQVVRHRVFSFRGIIFDVDPQFSNTDEWYESIPEEVRPSKDQPYYHLFAENERTHYIAYVSEQNLVPDDTDTPLSHPDIPEWFTMTQRGTYALKKGVTN